MENKPHFIFPAPQQPLTNDEAPVDSHSQDLKSLEKVVLQSFKYCQAKKSKNRYIRSKKLQEMKSYQKKLVTIIKKKSDEAITSLLAFSNQMVLNEETLCTQSSKTDDETLAKLKEKLNSLKEPVQTPSSTLLKQKLKRVTLECEEELEKMESSETSKKTDTQMDELIDRMERPFKKLCGYFSLLSKELKEMKEMEQEIGELKKTDSEETEV